MTLYFQDRDKYIQLTEMKFLVCYFPTALLPPQVDLVVETILRRSVSLITGFWGGDGINTASVQRLADMAHASGDGALTNAFSAGPRTRSRGLIRDILTRSSDVYFPNYYILFGPCNELQSRRREEPTVTWEELVKFHKEWGSDVDDFTALISPSIPLWAEASEGSPFSPLLGQVKLKPVRLERWRPGTMQLPIWLGRSVPGINARAKGKKRQLGRFLTKQAKWTSKRRAQAA